MDTRHETRKGIIEYLSQHMAIPANPQTAWQKVRRWRDKYGLPIEWAVNGSPFIDERAYQRWRKRSQRK